MTITDILNQINSAKSCEDIKQIIQNVDEQFCAGQITLTEKDWPEISSCVAKNKGRIERQAPFYIMQKCNNFYQHQLRNHPEKMAAISYLQARGLDGSIVREFQIGYAPPGWTNLRDSFTNEDNLLTQCGMLCFKEGQERGYDRFRNRIMFPIHNVAGQVVGFGSRVLDDSKPKYINSPETEIFHKGGELYGLYHTLRHNKKPDRIMIVEGNMDVVTAHQFGIRHAVATMGTACSPAHIHKCLQYTNELVFCFDGDAAGYKAAERALDAALQVCDEAHAIWFAFMPADEDPDSYVRKIGADKFLLFINEESIGIVEFCCSIARRGLNIDTIEGKALFVKSAASICTKIADPGLLGQLIGRMSYVSGLSADVINELIFNSGA